jgi:hypothetical protein
MSGAERDVSLRVIVIPLSRWTIPKDAIPSFVGPVLEQSRERAATQLQRRRRHVDTK